LLFSVIILAYKDKTISKTVINCNEKIAPKEKIIMATKVGFEVVQGSLLGCQLPVTPT